MYAKDNVYAKHRMVFPGTFDPFTLGHLSIVQRAAPLCDQLLIVVFDNSQKKPVMTRQARADLIRRVVDQMPAVNVLEYDGLLVDFCRQYQIDAIVRGVRSSIQFEEEETMAQINWKLGGGTDTVLLPARSELRHISSSMVREIARLGGDIKDFVPDMIEADILANYAAVGRGGI
jgi:pantetheine-phosphate adenylyltransferase